jgi:hypothetical protein
MNNTDKEREKNTIKQILYNNKYDTSCLHKFIPIEYKKRQEKKVKLKQNGPNLHTLVKDKIHRKTIKKFQSQNLLQN